MSLMRATEQSIQQRRDTLEKVKARIRRLEERMQLRSEPLWKDHIAPEIKASIEANQKVLDGILDAPPELQGDPGRDFANVKALRAAIRAYLNIYEQIENVGNVIERLRVMSDQLAEELKTIQREQQIV